MTTAPPTPLPVLIVDDEPQALLAYELLLSAGGIGQVLLCGDSRQVLPILEEQEVGALVLDLFMPHRTGVDLLPEITRDFPEIPVIILTGANRIEMAVQCMRDGAFDYLVKPVEEGRLLVSLRRALELRELRRENTRLSKHVLAEELDHPDAFVPIVTANPRMRSILRYIEAVAPSGMPMLVSGETGVGKELVARAIHRVSGRAGHFVALNVAGLDDSVFSDTLFGHRKGAFTGADAVRRGMIEQAAGGTLFLDEIGELSSASQVKLLRVLQDREYYPLGSDVPKLADARIVAATNRDIEELKSGGLFRKDLFFRLNTHHVHLPPLRERRDDIPLLVDQFLDAACTRLNKEKPRVPREMYALLQSYSFPGNVRELEAMVIDAVTKHHSGRLSFETLRKHVDAGAHAGHLAASQAPASSPFAACDPLPSLKAAAQMLTDEALRRAGGNQTVAAQVLGISQSALSRRSRRGRD